jgi:phage baseplate assembly protein W
MNVRFPFEIDHLGRVASTADHDEHVVELIEQTLFTNPGERVNRPTFGCGLLLLVFQSSNSQVAAATSTLIHAELQSWLGELINVVGVSTVSADSKLVITVEYIVLQTNTRHVAEFQRPE